MEHTAFDQHMDVAFLDPFQQLHCESRRIIRQCAEVQNIALFIHNTNWAGPKATGFFGQPLGHNRVGIQKIVHRIGIQRIHHLVDLVCVLNLRNVLRRCDNFLAVQNGSNLLQAQSILFNCQGGVNGADSIGTTQSLVSDSEVVQETFFTILTGKITTIKWANIKK